MTDTAAQAELLLEHGEFVRRLARGLVRDPDRAEDVVQETWLAALRNPPRAREAVAAWFRATTRNAAAKLDRGDRRRSARERIVATPEPVGTGADAIVQRLSLQRAVVDAVLALREPTRTAIVLRYFEDLTPTEIATRLDVPRNTVRARLRRGLERLRTDLDARHDGDRGRWLAGLLPIAGIDTTALVASTGATLTGTTLGGWTMTVKGLSSVAAATVLALVAITLIVPPEGPDVDDGHDRATAPRSATIAAPAPTDGVAGAGPATTSSAATRELAAADLPEIDEPTGAADDAPLADVGTVVFQAFDGVTGRPLPRQLSVRFLSEHRYADLETDEAVEARLTAGEWEASLRAPGYEPRTLEPFTLLPDQVTDLGWLGMDRGVGRISGLVRTPYLGADETVIVELHGDGRGPCWACAPEDEDGSRDEAAAWTRNSPCDTCGYHEESSTLTLVGGGSFSFVGLASGPYRIKLRTADDPVGIDRTVTLDRGGHAYLDLMLHPSATAWFELLDEEGHPFLREANRGRFHAVVDGGGRTIQIQSVKFTFRRGDEVVTDARYVHSTGMGHPMAAADWLVTPMRFQMTGNITFQSAVSGQVHLLAHRQLAIAYLEDAVQTESRLDRPREPADTLHPVAAPPERSFESTGASRPDGAGPIRISPLPAERLTVTVVSGGHASEPIAIHLHPGAPTLYRAVMRPRTKQTIDTDEPLVVSYAEAESGRAASLSVGESIFLSALGALQLDATNVDSEASTPDQPDDD